MQGLFQEITNAILNLQNNSPKHNETSSASGGSIGQYTTISKMKDLLIVTSDTAKAYLLDTKLANTFQANGIDLSSHIISFDELGGVYKTTKDVKVTKPIKEKLEAYGDYQVEEIKPKGEYFAAIYDVRGIRYKRCTKGMLKEPFYNGEFDETTYWIHYYSMKALSPFYNKVTITSEK